MKHLVEFTDGSADATGKAHDGITLSYSGDETLGKIDDLETPFIYGNGPGLVKLGEILIQLGLSTYKSGFHLHIRENFDADKREILIVGIGEAGESR